MSRGKAGAAARHWMMQRQRERAEETLYLFFVPLIDELEAELLDELGDLLIAPVYLTIEEYLNYREKGEPLYV